MEMCLGSRQEGISSGCGNGEIWNSVNNRHGFTNGAFEGVSFNTTGVTRGVKSREVPYSPVGESRVRMPHTRSTVKGGGRDR